MITEKDIMTGGYIAEQISASWESYDRTPELARLYNYYMEIKLVECSKIADEIEALCHSYIKEVDKQTGGRAGSMILAHFEDLLKILRGQK